MHKRLQLVGQRFGRWLVLEPAHRVRSSGRRVAYWRCVCDCGTQRNVDQSAMVRGQSVSCGCFQKDKPSAVRHNKHKTRAHSSWESMIQRCDNPKNSRYNSYGGRGITVCDEWREFARFYADMGDRPPGTSLDRIDNDKGYYAANCRWATAREQRQNQRIPYGEALARARPVDPAKSRICKSGHLVAGNNVYVSTQGRYECRECRRAAQIASHARITESKGKRLHSCSYFCQRPACVLAQRDLLRTQLAERDAEVVALRDAVGNLLARIHRDGGHYQTEHGVAKAVEDADQIVVDLRAALEELVACKTLKERIDAFTPRTASEGMALWKWRDEYEDRKPLAWERARKLVGR